MFVMTCVVYSSRRRLHGSLYVVLSQAHTCDHTHITHFPSSSSSSPGGARGDFDATNEINGWVVTVPTLRSTERTDGDA